MDAVIPSGYLHTNAQHESDTSKSSVEQSFFASSLLSPRTRDEGNCPPPLISRLPIPLPALTACPIILNPLLVYTANTPPITFSVIGSPSAATLSPSTTIHALTGRNSWRQEPAMRPANVGSMTIRLAGAVDFSLWRPIVVFPKSLYDSVVTVDDVLEAVSRAFRLAILERQGHRDKYGGSDNQRRRYASMPLNISSNRIEFYTAWWGGLYASPDERDVWILHTRSHV